jgi:uncharacterized repeat protein (TIGR03803 family)
MKKPYVLVGTLLAVALFANATPFANAQTYTVLHTFTGSPDGVYPSPLIRDADGNLYGAAQAGGNSTNNCLGGCGMVYKVDAAGNLTVLYNFTGGNNGAFPLAALTRDASGNLYGTTQGLGTFNLSVVFKLTPDGQETSFAAPIGSLDAPVVVDAKNNLYGMTPYGGTPNCGWEYHGLGCGTLFAMTPNGESTTIHNFAGTDGMFPQSGLVRDSKGNFYGAAVFGGIRTCRAVGDGLDNSPGCGTIFKVDVHGNYSVLHTFTGQSDGAGPLGVIIDSEDNLWHCNRRRRSSGQSVWLRDRFQAGHQDRRLQRAVYSSSDALRFGCVLCQPAGERLKRELVWSPTIRRRSQFGMLVQNRHQRKLHRPCRFSGAGSRQEPRRVLPRGHSSRLGGRCLRQYVDGRLRGFRDSVSHYALGMETGGPGSRR